MPRKSKITAVPVAPEASLGKQSVIEATEGEPRTDAEEMTELVKVIEDDKVIIAEVPQEIVADEPKPKPKRASRAKAKPEPKPNVEVEEQTSNDVNVEVELPKEVNKDVKSVEKVSCPDCGKQMSAKTLKYSHGPNCLVKKKEAQEAKTDRVEPSVSEEMIEELVQSRMNNVKKERLAKREQALEKLVAGAF